MKEAMEKKRPRKLNFSAPLLSTRRAAGGGSRISDKVSCTNSLVGWKDSSDGVPFCWEQAPGKPKKMESNKNVDEAEIETPRPKPPPGRWRPPNRATNGDHHDHDEGCDADVDDYDDDDDGNDDVFSDAMEVLSLTEAIDIVEKAEKFHGSSDGLKSKSLGPSDLEMSLDHSDCPSPNFIIERFLPDAKALAASSALNMSKTKLPHLCNYSDQSPCVSQAIMKRSSLISSPKRCGLEMLLPWRMKHKLCGVKSPIKGRSTNIVQAKSSTKHKKLFSSILAPSGEWRCK